MSSTVILRPKIAIVTTTVLQVNFFLVPHLNALNREFDVTLIVNNDFPSLLASLNLPVKTHFVNIQRKVSPIKDLITLFQLLAYFREQKFDMVHSVNPKAGLLAMLAAWLVRIPVRAHIFQGEVWANKKGLWRFILRNLDRLVSLCATHLTVVSQSERQFLISEKIISTSKSRVLANGSIGGVDLNKFKPEAAAREELRRLYCYTDETVVFMYLGRLTREKGLEELAEAFTLIASGHPQVCLQLVGPDEDDILDLYAPLLLKYPDRVRVLPFSKQPNVDLQVADVLILPSHREGFGVVVIEAAALGIPSIGSRVYGISDALIEGETGLMFPVSDKNELGRAMVMLLDSNIRQRLGLNARQRVEKEFDQKLVLSAFVEYHRILLNSLK